jgi:hypothetical protein
MPDLSTAQPKTTAKLTVEVEPPDAGVVTVSPEKSSYSRGDQVSLSVTSKDEDTYEFVSWGGDIDESSESVTVTLDCDMTVIAKFKDVLAMDLVDDCEDNNARTFLKSVWFTFTDGSSSISPNTDESTSFKMTEGGYNSEYAVKIEYSLQGGGQGDPYVGVGFGMTRANDPTDISDATGFRFYYKGSFPDTTVGLKIETDAGVEAGAEHRYFLTPSSSWKEVSLSWDDFLQPKWTKNPSNLDLGSVKLFQWQVQGKGGSGELWLDDIHLVGYYIYRVPVVQQRYAPQNTSCTIIPFSKGYAATYATGRDGMVNCVLYDLCGRQVRNLVSKFMQAGNHSLHIAPDDAQLSNNGYILRLSTVDGTYTKQLIVNR